MTGSPRAWLAAALILAAACTDTRTPLAPENPAPALPPALQAVDCTIDRTQEAMRCGDPQPQTGAALGSGGVIVGGQNRYVRLASSDVTWSADTLRLDVTVQNLIHQPLGTTNGTTADPGGVRVFFTAEPAAHPTGTAWVANADDSGIFIAPAQPFFQYDGLLGAGEVSAPRTWKFAFTPGTSRVTFTVYVAAQVEQHDPRLAVTPDDFFLLLGDTAHLSAVLRDFTGGTRPVAVTWTTGDDRLAAVDSAGVVTGLREGQVVIRAHTADGQSAHAEIIVVEEQTIVDVEAGQDTVTLQMGETAQLSAVAYNLDGEVVSDGLQWTEYNQWVAQVKPFTSLVRGTHPGTTPVYVGGGWASDTVYVVTLPGPETTWKSISTAQGHSCGVATTGKAYCWGHNGAGQLGWGQAVALDESVPVAVAGDIEFAMVDGGNWFTCGVGTNGQAWCWGYGYYGQLGNGVEGYTDGVPTPQAVQGGHTFTTLSAGFEHACGLDTDGKAWCWGNNTYGQLGNGETVVVMGEPVPVEVTGGHTFKHISSGRDATCALTDDGEMYCWGDNEAGQFGDGAGAPALLVPNPVPGGVGHRWKDVELGDSHVCGLTTAGEAYCWGMDEYGELGIGVAEMSDDVPMKVVVAETFTDIGVGTYHSCAVAVDGTAWCWGYNRVGQLGRGEKESFDPYPVPQPVIGGVQFAGKIQGGFQHTCALGTDGKAYCWGADFHGEGGIQPDVEFCSVPGGVAPCHTQPRAVANPAPGGIRTGPTSPWPAGSAAGAAVRGTAAPESPRARLRRRPARE